MLWKCIKRSFWVILFLCLSGSVARVYSELPLFALRSEQKALSFDIFLSSTAYKKIENACLELCDDIDLYNMPLDCVQGIFNNFDYILAQLCSWYKAVDELVRKAEESPFFLVDDIAYLLDLVAQLENKVARIVTRSESDSDKVVFCLSFLINQGRLRLEKLMSHTIEVRSEDVGWD